MKQFIKKLFGIDKIEAAKILAEQETTDTLARAADAKVREETALQAEKLAKTSPKERANARGEPYVAVLETHVAKDNLRNGFLELDWNDLFVLQLKQQGYGFDGDPDEEIVDRWFRTLCKDIAGEESVDMTDRGAGYINVKKIAEGKTEVS